MKNTFFLILGVVIVVGSFYLFLQRPASNSYQKENWKTEKVLLPGPALKVGEKFVPIEIAETPESRTLGLSGRESLEKGTGLLFIFEGSAEYGFWMKEMKFPIDIVWIDENWIVAGVERGVSPDTFPQKFYPSRPVKYVLELNSGDALNLGIDTGVGMSFDR